MRTLSILALVFVTCLLANSQSQSDQKPAETLPNFVVIYTTGAAWDTTKAPNEQAYFSEHSAQLAALRKSGIISLGGRYGDKGMIILTAANKATADSIVFSDVAVRNRLFEAEVYLFQTFYGGCVYK
jgi:hypothetical protein